MILRLTNPILFIPLIVKLGFFFFFLHKYFILCWETPLAKIALQKIDWPLKNLIECLVILTYLRKASIC